MSLVRRAFSFLTSPGTRSLLFGAHYPLHPIEVALAWRWLYGQWPSLREALAIAVHDLGYLGVQEFDGEDGTRHPELGARIAGLLLGEEYAALVRGHSKGYAELVGAPLSRLYGPDKLSHAFEPAWFYVLRTRATGEIRQYRATAHGCAPRCDDPGVSDEAWFRVIRARMARGGISAVLEQVGRLGEHRGR